jgi:hypothetical protein
MATEFVRVACGFDSCRSRRRLGVLSTPGFSVQALRCCPVPEQASNGASCPRDSGVVPCVAGMAFAGGQKEEVQGFMVPSLPCVAPAGGRKRGTLLCGPS